ncbi:RNA polymerase sigma factor [Leptolyngbya ohadii]|uniref:RNA polymerase sigma factor n=1 Tax=Leptolyngbya ohadii TaxID=1962290 RepID=UPI000B59A24D|nr:RNA polymerase subunit sigma-70 [Leptolyngbya ohadii]
MQIPKFPECNHAIVSSLEHYSDPELLLLFQRHPDAGKYFLAIFCRYSPIVYSLIHHSIKSPAQADYLFAVTWRHIYYELGGLDLRGQNPSEGENPTLQSWLIQVTALCINRVELPPVESIQYSLREASPPLWCFVEQALEQLHPAQRLIVLLSQTFHWSETRIAAYLQAEGQIVTPAEVRRQIEESQKLLESALPADVAAVYLDRSIDSPMDGTGDMADLPLSPTP